METFQAIAAKRFRNHAYDRHCDKDEAVLIYSNEDDLDQPSRHVVSLQVKVIIEGFLGDNNHIKVGKPTARCPENASLTSTAYFEPGNWPGPWLWLHRPEIRLLIM